MRKEIRKMKDETGVASFRKVATRKVSSFIFHLFLTGALLFPSFAVAAVPPNAFPRTANYYLKAGIGIPPSDHERLAKYDLLVLPAEAQVFNRAMFAELRRMNPDIILLAYVPTKSYALVWNDSLHDGLKADLRDEWRLRDSSGNQLSVWPNTYSLNVASGWSDYLASYVKDDILSTGLWDGIFYDEASATISWLNGGDLDLDRNGFRDAAADADRWWEEGMIRLLRKTREAAGPDAIIVMNGDSDPDLQKHVNGRMFESFPTPWEGNGSWATVTGNYLRLRDQVGFTPVFIVNGNTANTGNRADYAKMRYGLASALLGDAFFGFDFGEQDHGQLWMYDEYSASLGSPTNAARNLTGQSSPVQPGVWRRDFQNGIALVNSTDRAQTVDLDGDFERLHGTQDPSVNNGEIGSTVTIPAKDGLILLRPLEKLTDASYRNGAFTRILSSSGAALRTGFFAYTSAQRGGRDVAEFPNGRSVTASGNRLELRGPDGAVIRAIAPFGENYPASVSFSVGKAGGKTYVSAGGGQGGEPFVRLLDAELNPVTEAWHAYHYRFTGGVSTAVGDIDADGAPELAAGAGPGGGPHVRLFNRDGGLRAQFFAYSERFRGGVTVGLGDVDGDGLGEIVTGPGFGGGPHVRVFNHRGEVESQFFAYDSKKNGGVRVTVSDVNGDGKPEILAMTNDVFTLAFAGGSRL